MTNISIFSNNNAFAEDLKTQISLHLPDTEVCINTADEKTNLLLVDENEKTAADRKKQTKRFIRSTASMDISSILSRERRKKQSFRTGHKDFCTSLD